MKISEVYPDYVFQRLAKYRVVAVDFTKGGFIELDLQNAGQIKRLVQQAKTEGQIVLFWQYEEE